MLQLQVILIAVLTICCLVQMRTTHAKLKEVLYFTLLYSTIAPILLIFAGYRELWRHDVVDIANLSLESGANWIKQLYLFWERSFDLTTPYMTDSFFGFFMVLPLLMIALYQRFNRQSPPFAYPIANLIFLLAIILNPVSPYDLQSDTVATTILFALYMVNLLIQLAWMWRSADCQSAPTITADPIKCYRLLFFFSNFSFGKTHDQSL